MRRSLVLLVLIVSPVLPASAQASRTVVVTDHVVTRIGDFKTSGRTGGTLAKAIRTFGQPSSRRSRYGGTTCLVRWRKAKVYGDFANYGGGGSACDPGFGRAQTITLRARGWQTRRGLRIGARSSEVQRRHPAAAFRSGRWWIVSAYSPVGDGADYPVLSAGVASGRVRSFKMVVGAAGE